MAKQEPRNVAPHVARVIQAAMKPASGRPQAPHVARATQAAAVQPARRGVLQRAFEGSGFQVVRVGDSSAWEVIDPNPQWENCTDFAFQGDPVLCMEGRLSKLLKKAKEKGYAETSDLGQAVVILFGKNGNYSHAIRKVGGQWHEVKHDGGPMRKYTGPDAPPKFHGGDYIVAMLSQG